MKLLLLFAFLIIPVLTHAERDRGFSGGAPYQREAREDFRGGNAGYYGGGFYGDGYYPGFQQPTYRQTPQYQEETLQNAGDPMEEEQLQNINDMANEPDIG